jgi:hypothetical protein
MRLAVRPAPTHRTSKVASLDALRNKPCQHRQALMRRAFVQCGAHRLAYQLLERWHEVCSQHVQAKQHV